MTKTLSRIQAQISKLQKEADAIRAREVGDVVKRIREAIAHYDLKVADLFSVKSAKPAVKAAAKKPGRKRGASPIKYRDEAGHTWTGVGKRPNWFKDALAAGKTKEDLQVR